MKIGFKFGPDPKKSEPHLELGAMTLIVGPNGVGKSLLLREIRKLEMSLGDVVRPSSQRKSRLLGCFHATGPRPTEQRRWASRIEKTTADRIDSFIRHEILQPPARKHDVIEAAGHLVHDYETAYYQREEIPSAEQYLHNWRGRPVNELRSVIGEPTEVDTLRLAQDLLARGHLPNSGVTRVSIYLSTLSSRLTTLERCGPQAPHDDERHPLMRLLVEDRVRADVNRALSSLGGFRLAVDPTNMTVLRAVSYDAADGPPPESTPWSEESRVFFARTNPLSKRCDGERSLAALVVECLLYDIDLLLLDEPEISLHPPLARQLGALLTNLAEERGFSIIAATHSPEFVAGCLSTRHPVSICRLDYRDGQGSAEALSTDLVTEMSTDPLLRSTGILGALFHKGALVCEGASDVALYGEISDRLAIHEPDYPKVMRDVLMINANGRKSLPKVVAKLRASGVPCACITDLDLLNDNAVLEALLRGINAHESLVQSLLAMSDQVSKIFAGRKPLLKSGGASALTAQEAEVVKMFTDTLARSGIFVPENGALEQWLLQFTKIPRGKRHKQDFIPSIFEAMGPTATGLVPAEDDIWAFLRRVASWLTASDAKTT